ncbi:MAG TPA: WYL domain-containing protein, partial [Candidatus Limnocylindrales bacterium]|nr:WYL domain-containing protein [Candidatus Limnocylindrales bacterium]
MAALLFLQSRGRVTAAELAAELEISDRTARRDLEALSMAGIPVYSQPGRGGGWSLVGGARTDLSGLTAAEARTLFLVAGPSASATPQVKAALRKLVRALPEPFRAEAEAAASAVVLDPRTWDRPSVTPPPHLDILQRAVVDGVQVRLRYVGRDRPESERIAHPLGLVSKASVWYLVAGTDAGLRTFRLSRVRSVTLTDDPVDRPEGFDLEQTWNEIVDTLSERRAGFRATARVVADAVGWIRSAFGVRVTVGQTGGDGRVEVQLRSWSADALADELAGSGAMVEVIDPPEARAALARLGE